MDGELDYKESWEPKNLCFLDYGVQSFLLEEEVERRGRPYFIWLWLKKKKKKKTHLKLCNTESTILTIFKCTAQQQHMSSPRCVEFQNFSIRKPEAQAHSMQMPLLQPLVTTFYFSASMILDNFGYFLKLESDGVCPLWLTFSA